MWLPPDCCGVSKNHMASMFSMALEVGISATSVRVLLREHALLPAQRICFKKIWNLKCIMFAFPLANHSYIWALLVAVALKCVHGAQLLQICWVLWEGIVWCKTVQWFCCEICQQKGRKNNCNSNSGILKYSMDLDIDWIWASKQKVIISMCHKLGF